jgi:hypothetical protein
VYSVALSPTEAELRQARLGTDILINRREGLLGHAGGAETNIAREMSLPPLQK